MAKISELKKFLSMLRLEVSENLGEMANRLDYAMTYLSGIENGKRDIPKSFFDKVVKEYRLSEQKSNELHEILIRCSPVVEIEHDGKGAKSEVLMKMVNNELDDEAYEEILSLLEKNKQNKD